MKKLVWTSKFLKSSEKFLKNNPELINLYKEKIKLIEEDPYHISLKTHKLKGRLSGFYSASINFDYRIVFQIDDDANGSIILHNIGSHDEVY